MTNIDDHIEAVNSLLSIFRRNTEKDASGPSGPWVPKLDAVVTFLSEQKRIMAPIPRALGDVSDLPDELLRELSVTKTDELEDQIMTVMRACQGEANLDQVLVGLYRKFKVVQTRRFIQNKLYRMSKKELVYQVPGQRASYSLDPQSGSGDPPNAGGGYDINTISRVAPKAPQQSDLDDEIPF